MDTSPKNLLGRLARQARARQEREDTISHLRRLLLEVNARFRLVAISVSIAEAQYKYLSRVPFLERRLAQLSDYLEEIQANLAEQQRVAVETEQNFLLECRTAVRNSPQLASLRKAAEDAAMRLTATETEHARVSDNVLRLSEDLRRATIDRGILRMWECFQRAERRYAHVCEERACLLDRISALENAEPARRAG